MDVSNPKIKQLIEQNLFSGSDSQLFEDFWGTFCFEMKTAFFFLILFYHVKSMWQIDMQKK